MACGRHGLGIERYQKNDDGIFFGEVRFMNHRFSIGDRVRVTGILAEFYAGKTGIVVALEPNANGVKELDRYVVEIQGVQMADTKLADFQLALTSDERG